jgi:hypothetical protein
LRSAPVRHIPVGWVKLEEFLLSLEGIRKGLVPLDVLLRSVDHPDKSELQRVNSS